METKLRSGFTTGSCAAAAAKAAAIMLLSGAEKDRIRIITPKGVAFDAVIEEAARSPGSASCAVRKDGGDDPDVTTGLLICAAVSFSEKPGVHIRGGRGVGTVTRPGLDQPVGEAAVNSVPRRMITEEVSDVMRAFDYAGGLEVEISVPGGEETAARTFNPRLGIEGGISIIGTSGVVEPMSEQAILDTIRVELRQKRAEGYSIAFVSPGNYGLDFMKETYDVDLDRSVKCSNYIGLTTDMIRGLGFEGMLLTGHAGKLVKVAGGVMDTHSKHGDRRMEIIAEAAAKEGADAAAADALAGCVTTEEAFALLGPAVRERVSKRLVESIVRNLKDRAGAGLGIECIMYTKMQGILAASSGAEALIARYKRQCGSCSGR